MSKTLHRLSFPCSLGGARALVLPLVLPLVLALAHGARAQACLLPIEYGTTTTTGTISQANQVQCYRLQGVANERIRVHYVSNFYAVFEILRPVSGTQLCFGNYNTSQVDCTLDATGQHQLKFRSDIFTRTGTFWFSIQRLNDPVGGVSVCYENPVSSVITAPAQVNCYRFPGTADKVVRISKVSDFYASAEVLRPDGSPLCFANYNVPELDCTLPVTGLYTLLIRSDILSRTGTCDFRLECRTFPCECTASFENYGAGWPGRNGVVPSLTLSGRPVLGSQVNIQMGNTSGADAAAVLLLGVSTATTATEYGGTVLLAPTTMLAFVLPSAGASLPWGIDNQTYLCNLCIKAQAVQTDPAASHGLAFSRGLSLILGR